MHTRRLRREVALGLGLSMILLLTSAVSGVVAGATSRVVAVLYRRPTRPIGKFSRTFSVGSNKG